MEMGNCTRDGQTVLAVDSDSSSRDKLSITKQPSVTKLFLKIDLHGPY